MSKTKKEGEREIVALEIEVGKGITGVRFNQADAEALRRAHIFLAAIASQMVALDEVVKNLKGETSNAKDQRS